jgi:hypothetical protein
LPSGFGDFLPSEPASLCAGDASFLADLSLGDSDPLALLRKRHVINARIMVCYLTDCVFEPATWHPASQNVYVHCHCANDARDDRVSANVSANQNYFGWTT